MKTFFIRRWFLIALALVLSVGIGLSHPLKPLASAQSLRYIVVAVVLFLMAFPLKATSIWQSFRQPLTPLLASAINYGLLPLFAWFLVIVLTAAFGFSEDMRHGTLVAATTPCTLASAAVWTRRAGGNDAAALMVTIITNLLCFLITPAWLLLTIGRTADFEPTAMIVKLALLVVLPMVVAQCLRLVGSIGAWATDHKTPLGVGAQCGVLTMIFFGAIQTGNKYAGGPKTAVWLDIGLMIAAVLCIHLTMLLVGFAVSRLIGLPHRDRIAVGFAGSQKTCMVGLEVSAQLGVTMLPMVAYHVGQLLADTLIADRIRVKSAMQKKTAAEPQPSAR